MSELEPLQHGHYGGPWKDPFAVEVLNPSKLDVAMRILNKAMVRDGIYTQLKKAKLHTKRERKIFKLEHAHKRRLKAEKRKALRRGG